VGIFKHTCPYSGFSSTPEQLLKEGIITNIELNGKRVIVRVLKRYYAKLTCHLLSELLEDLLVEYPRSSFGIVVPECCFFSE